ncbi:MAG: phenylacetate--CoA ligase family protein, partial [Anaerolineae bacterium]
RPSLFRHIWRTGRRKPAAAINIRQQRLTNLVAFARSHSPFYAQHYRQVSSSPKLYELPPVTKPELMACFDDWVTDTAVTKAGVNAFVADPSLVGRPYLDRYAVHTTSGTSGTPGIFLHDSDALTIYDLLLLRGWLAWLGPWRLLSSLRPGFREVFVVATGAHFAGVATTERLRRWYPWPAGRLQNLSVLLPLVELVQKLNHLQPTVLVIYPTALSLLARAQRDGRLSIRPLFIVTSGEWLAPVVRDEAAAVFNCPVRDIYGCSEFIYMALACNEGWLHVNADWLILEPVDAGYSPVSPGQASHTVLLTNLANRIQPLIRYDLGDSITLRPEPCPCGNPLPALRVEGRRDEILTFPTAEGAVVQVLPMALAAVVEATPGVQRYQLIQPEPLTLAVRLEVVPGAEGSRVWETAVTRLREYLTSQGLTGVTIRETTVLPRCDPHSGKFRQVWSEVGSTTGNRHQKTNL